MPQGDEQFLRMPDAASAERLVNVVSDLGPDGFPAMGLLQQVVCHGGGSDFRNVLVLADGGDFVFVQSAKGGAQSSKEIIASSHLCASVKATTNLAKQITSIAQ